MELQNQLKNTTVLLVDGEMFSWYGSRLLYAADYFAGLSRHLSQEQLRAFGVIDENGKPIHDPLKNMKTIEEGAATIIWCVTSPQLDGMGGVYCENCDISPLIEKSTIADRSKQISFGVMPYAVDPETADRLWSLSEKLTNVKF